MPLKASPNRVERNKIYKLFAEKKSVKEVSRIMRIEPKSIERYKDGPPKAKEPAKEVPLKVEPVKVNPTK